MNDSHLETALNAFRHVLRCACAEIGELARTNGGEPKQFRADWAQANWEAIVEAAVSNGGLFLEPYGDGADCNPVGSRVWMPGTASTHAVVCHPAMNGARTVDRLTNEEVTFPPGGLLFDRFACSTPEGWWSEEPPFDHVLTLSGENKEMLFRLNEVGFALRSVDRTT